MIEILTYIATFSPGVAAVVGVLIFLMWGAKQLSATVANFKTEASKLTEEDAKFKEKLDQLLQDNKSLKESNAILASALTHIDNYIEEKERERNAKKEQRNN